MAHRMARPCRVTRPTDPLSTLLTRLPTAPAAVRMPTVTGPPPSTTAPTAGNSTRGCPSVMAMMSTMNDMRMFGAVLRNPSPYLMDASPGRCTSPSGAIRGSASTPVNAARKSTASTV